MQSLVAVMDGSLAGPGGCNDGFLRDDALLVVIFITDEDDDPSDGQGHMGSPGDPADWYDALVAAKGGDEEKVVVGALLGDELPELSECPWMLEGDDEAMASGAEPGVRLRSLLKLFPPGHRYDGSICRDQFSEFFAHLFEETVDGACSDLALPVP